MRMCVRCGAKGQMQYLRITVCETENYSAACIVMEQGMNLCEVCVQDALDQLSVVISNQTWEGDQNPE